MKTSFLSTLLALLFALPVWAAVDVNMATQSELESVKGLGPAKAKAIIDYREKHGPFKSLDELANVKGLGKASVAKFQSDLSVNEAQSKGVKSDKSK